MDKQKAKPAWNPRQEELSRDRHKAALQLDYVQDNRRLDNHCLTGKQQTAWSGSAECRS